MISRSNLLAEEKETQDTGGEVIRFKGGGGRHLKAQVSWGMIYPQLFLKGENQRTAHRTRGQTHSRTTQASSWLQTPRKEESEATQPLSHVKYPLAIPQHN